MGIALVVVLVFIVGALHTESRKRRATTDGSAGWAGDGGPECDTGTDSGCDGGGDGGGGGGGD
jgi:hypothetical protein